MVLVWVVLFTGPGSEQEGEEEAMEDEEEGTELEEFSFDRVHSGFFAGNAFGEEILFSLP